MARKNPVRFTDRYIEGLKPRSERYREGDAVEPGLGIIVHPTGRKVWNWRGHINKKLVTVTMGSFPAYTLADAREWVRKINRGKEQRVNVVAKAALERAEQERRDERTCDWLFGKYMDNEGNHVKSAPEKWRLYNREIRPSIGSKSIFEICHDDLAIILQGKLDTAPSVSNHMHSLIKRWFCWSVTQGRHISGLSANPAADLVKLAKVRSRMRYLDDYELSLLIAVLDAGRWKMAQPLWLILYTGTRRSEAFGARWSEFDFQKGVWTIPVARAKNNRELILPLPDEALALVKAAAPFVKVHELIWPSYGDPSKPMSGFSKAVDGIHAAMQKLAHSDGRTIEPWTIHDLRRSVATGMNGLHDAEHRPLIPSMVVERLMNHKLPGMQGVYNRWEYFAEKKAALRLWAEHLNALRARKI